MLMSLFYCSAFSLLASIYSILLVFVAALCCAKTLESNCRHPAVYPLSSGVQEERSYALSRGGKLSGWYNFRTERNGGTHCDWPELNPNPNTLTLT